MRSGNGLAVGTSGPIRLLEYCPQAGSVGQLERAGVELTRRSQEGSVKWSAIVISGRMFSRATHELKVPIVFIVSLVVAPGRDASREKLGAL